MPDPLVETRGLGRRIGQKWLLHPATLSITAGQRVALLGPSGSGKTLLLRCLALLDPCDCGQLLWRGSPVRGSFVPYYRSQVIYLHQRPTLFEGTVLDNLQQPFRLRSHRGSCFDRPRILQLLAAVERYDDFLHQPTQQLSGGESQLVALLRAIQLDPRILLLDEPTAALDHEAQQMVEHIVANWLGDPEAHAHASVWVTHDPRQALRVADTLYRIRDGELAPAESHP